MIQQPSARYCFVCGVENPAGLHIRFFETETQPVEVHAEVTVPDHFQGYPGVVHGGILATMLDETASRTIFRGDPLRFVVTGKLSIRYRKPVPVATPLKLVGRVVEDKGRVILTSAQVLDSDGRLLAEADVTLMEVESRYIGDRMHPDDWKVYPVDEPDKDGGER